MPRYYYIKCLDDYGVVILHSTLEAMGELLDINFSRILDVKGRKKFVTTCSLKFKDLVERSPEKRSHFKIYTMTKNGNLFPVPKEKEIQKKMLHKKIVLLKGFNKTTLHERMLLLKGASI